MALRHPERMGQVRVGAWVVSTASRRGREHRKRLHGSWPMLTPAAVIGPGLGTSLEGRLVDVTQLCVRAPLW